MKFFYIFLFGIVLTSFASSVYYPLDDARDGCLGYASAEKRIVGNPDTEEGYKAVYKHDFQFYIPEIEGKSQDLHIRVRSTYGFDTIKDCNGPYGLIAKINNVRAFADGISSCNDGYDYSCMVLYPGEPLLTGKNSLFLTNTSGEKVYCSGGSGCPKQRTGICTFRVCGFYPELDILSTVPPSSIGTDGNFNLSVNITNNDEVDAGSVTIKVMDSDFYVSPSKTTETILAKNETPFNEFKYTITFKPKKYTELETGSTSVPKRIGKIVATFTDVNGKERKFEKKLGSITVVKPLPISEKNVSTMSSPSQANISKPTSQPSTSPEKETQESYICLPGILLLLPLLFLRS